MQKQETLLVVGYAKLPENIVTGSGSGVLSLELEVELSTDIIVDAFCSDIPPLGTNLIPSLLIGYDLKHTLNNPVEEIRRRFFGPAQRAVIAALGKAYEEYMRCKNSMSQEDKDVKSLKK